MRASVAACCASGSFPLTQGKQVSVTRHRHHRGLIPAHAGKTAAPAWTPGGRPAHPRSGGENWSLRPSHLWMWGSSPLTRGKRSAQFSRPFMLRLIPAHAGKTSKRILVSSISWAHPRSRGENRSRLHPRRGGRDSSPLTRGKRPAGGECPCEPRLIPAHAGKTVSPASSWTARRAHPRSRGENISPGTSRPLVAGSSPLTRGKLFGDPSAVTFLGLIPAHAGKTRPRLRPPPSKRAHPRSRGENPHVAAIELEAERLIPAHAGKTARALSGARTVGAHPRSRGENPRSLIEIPGFSGSSPLTRGKPGARISGREAVRLIPAHAGKTWCS